MTSVASGVRTPRSQTIAVLTGASVMLTISMGMRQSFGLFVTPVTQDLGLTVADFTLAIAVQNLVWGLTQPVIGAFADRYGCRVMTVGGTFLYAAGSINTHSPMKPITATCQP